MTRSTEVSERRIDADLDGLAGEPGVVVRLSGVHKRFGATHALKGVDLEISRGSIHALIGENGAGKSTALGIVAGRIRPTSGLVELDGDEIPYGRPRALRDAGVLAVYQELTIAPLLSVEANLFLGRSISSAGILRERDMADRYLEICAEIGVQPSRPGTPAGELSVADQQLIEIMRVFVSDCRVILLDEPTASLAVHEREAVYRVLGQLRDRGMAIVIVSHNLDEVLDLADTITVFRDGSLVRSAPRSEWTKGSMVTAMIGDKGVDQLGEHFAASRSGALRGPANEDPPQDALLHVTHLSVPRAISDVELSVRAGEIVGLAGLVGSGRSTVLRALYGLEPTATGDLVVEGRAVGLPRSVRRARALGIALLPEDRKNEGLVLSMSAGDNVVLGDLRSTARGGVLSRTRVRRRAAAVSAKVGFAETRLDAPARSLSGGNQQKLLLARWLLAGPKILLVDEPSRGVDIGARSEILRALEQTAASGVGIVMVSSELEELAMVCTRVIVLSRGTVAGEIDGMERRLDVSEMLHLAFNAEGDGDGDD